MTNTHYKIKRFDSFIFITSLATTEEITSFLSGDNEYIISNEVTGLEYNEQNNEYIIFEWINYELVALDDFPFTENDFFYEGKWNRPSNTATLKVENFVGSIKFREQLFSVHSKKMEFEKVNELINYVDDKISRLSLHFNSKAISKRTFERNKESDEDDFSEFVFLYTLLKSKRLINNFKLILKNPYRTFQNIVTRSNIYEVTEFSAENFIDVFSGKYRLTKSNSELPLVKKLNGHIPKEINVHNNIPSIDNNENQFVLFFLNFCIRILTKRIKELELKLIQMNSIINHDFLSELKGFRKELVHILRTDFFQSISKLSTINKSSPVLNKRIGYKELYNFYLNMKSVPVNIIDKDDFTELFENKSIDKLYEYVGLFYLDEYLQEYYSQGEKQTRINRQNKNFSIILDERNDKIIFKYTKENYPTTKLYFQRSYTKVKNTSYAISQSPDFSLFIEKNGKVSLYHFDTKFRINVFDKNENNLTKPLLYAKSEDLKSMHAYKDGIKETIGAYVLYPGDEHSEIGIYSAHEESDLPSENITFNKYEGIGSIPLLINDNSDLLKNFIVELIEWHNNSN